MSSTNTDLEVENLGEPDPFVADFIDPEQVRSWILDCEGKHGDRCNTTEHQSAIPATELKLIDVIDQCIVKASPTVRYFALSYMWGGVTQMLLTTETGAELSVPGSLLQHRSKIPAVIQDAVAFVAALNERYLWVDSLCIVQNDVKMKHHQILQMGAIYNGAVASLVGVVGINANSGLAGVKPRTRIPEQRRVQYQNVYLINPRPGEYTSLRKPLDNSHYTHLGRRMKARQMDLSDRLMKSNYSTRAWTYQERLLSRRCIYFMDNMVYYHCRSAIRGENKATPYNRKSENIRPLSLFMADPIFSGDTLRYQKTLGAIYAGIVVEFTRKKLSFPLDILNAFSGISSAMEKLCSWRMVAGMPENLLDYTLLWLPASPSERRCQQAENTFPSWSWAGWCVEVDYESIFRTEAGFEPYLADSESLIHQLSICDQYGTRRIQGSMPVNEWVANLAMKAGSSLRMELSDWLSRIGNSQVLNETLVFQALTYPFKDCGSLRIGTIGSVRPDLGLAQRTVARFEFHFTGRALQEGTLIGAGLEMLSISQRTSYDIVFLSITKGIGDDFEQWIRDLAFTHIMLIKWTGDFAERVGIGRMEVDLTKGSYAQLNSGARFTFPPADELLDFFNWKTIRLI